VTRDPSLPLAGARILVIGAGTMVTTLPDPPVGNGRAISVLAARQGARVVCADLNEAAAQETADWITREGGEAHVLVGDASDADRCAAFVHEAAELLGGLDGLVYNTGIGWGMGIAGTSVSDWDHVMAVNLRGPFVATRAALDHLDEGGSIVLIGSVSGDRPGTGIPSYDTSKAGLGGLCRAAALELAPRGSRVNIVAPGLVDSVLGRIATMIRPDRAEIPIPLGRQGTAWEVAEVVTFMLSKRASYITGQTITVDGGLTLHAL
jgi:NAD(P)-dependent dehydrogenase (short-subunit alcohol dehydrogenase family)